MGYRELKTPRDGLSHQRDPVISSRALMQNATAGLRAYGVQGSLLEWQRLRGNHYVQRAISPTAIDIVAAGIPEPLENSINRRRRAGKPLNTPLRLKMESAFGADFSGVRVHTDPLSNNLNHAIGALAFTTGKDIFFRKGDYDPNSSTGRRLIAHELAHVVQSGGANSQTIQTVSNKHDAYEGEAEQAAAAVMQGKQEQVPIRTANGAGSRLFRYPAPEEGAEGIRIVRIPRETVTTRIWVGGYFMTGSDVLVAGIRERVLAWYRDLSDGLRRAIAEGQASLTLTGQGERRNGRGLIDRRMNNIVEALREAEFDIPQVRRQYQPEGNPNAIVFEVQQVTGGE